MSTDAFEPKIAPRTRDFCSEGRNTTYGCNSSVKRLTSHCSLLNKHLKYYVCPVRLKHPQTQKHGAETPRCVETITVGWAPTDGDTFVTKEGFIFNVFGYEHPDKRVLAFLKYIPAKFKHCFNVGFLERTWNYGKTKMFRAEKLYTPQNYQAFLAAFRDNFPDYVYHCHFRERDVISAPLASIQRVYVPRDCLQALAESKNRDDLQETALDFVNLLSHKSKIGKQDFGVHGSVALNMHSPKSDIDIVIYGAENFRRLKRTIDSLVNAGILTYQTNNRLDAVRRFKGRYKNRVFMYNAIRKPHEIHSKYGTSKYMPMHSLKFRCVVIDDSEAMFRPAIYRIGNYEPINKESRLQKNQTPQLVISMIGCYRNVARKGEEIGVSGMLERVENPHTGETFHQVVVGTATGGEEVICPL